jgi:hypothetical protein
MKPALIFSLLFLLGAPAKEEKPPAYHERVTWTERDWGGKSVPCSLELWTQSKGMERCILRCRFETSVGLGEPDIWDVTNTFRDSMWAQIDLAVAIRVQGETQPQILVKRSRSNWGDYILYTVGEGGLSEVFSISHRGEDCIQWISRNGALERFILFDRWQTQGRPPEEPGKRWQERSEYVWNTKKQEWQQVKRQWQTYRFGIDELKNPVFEKPSDCPFRFQRPKPTTRRART